MYKTVKTVLSLVTAISCLHASPAIYAEETAPTPISEPSPSAEVSASTEETTQAESIVIAEESPEAVADAAQETPVPSAEATPEIKEEPDEETASPQASALPEFSAAPSAAAPSAEPEAAAAPTPDAAPGLPRKIMRAPGNSQHATGYIEDLSDDDEYIEMFKVLEQDDGTEPWDNNDDPGNDSSASNNIVRTFDYIDYTLQFTSAPYTDGAYYRNGYIRFKMVLPMTSSEAVFNTSAMGWMISGTGTDYDWQIKTETVNGQESQVLYCAMKLSADTAGTANVLPCIKQTAFVSIQVTNAKANQKFTPVFSVWMDHNTTDGTCAQHNRNEVVSVSGNEITVSASPSYNVWVSTEGAVPVKNYDFNTGDSNAPNKGIGQQHGYIAVFGTLIELRNTGNSQKKLRGVEVPTGPISFDLDLDYYMIDSSGNRQALSGVTINPMIWSYGGNNGHLFGRTTGTEPRGLPHNFPNGSGGGQNGVVNSGNTAAVLSGDGKTLSVTITDYEINDKYFPVKQTYGAATASVFYNNADYGKGALYTNRGVFISLEYCLFVGFNTEELYARYGASSLCVSAKLNNLKTTSLSGNTANSDIVTTDDSATASKEIRAPGGYDHMINYCRLYSSNTNVQGQVDDYSSADDIGFTGQKISIRMIASIRDTETDFHAGEDRLVKFDASAITPPSLPYRGDLAWAAKPDGTDWISDEEKDSAGVDDLVYYKTYEELKAAGKKCVGFVQSARHRNKNSFNNSWTDDVRIDGFTINSDAALNNTVHSVVIMSNVYSVNLTSTGFTDDDLNIPYFNEAYFNGASLPAPSMKNWTSVKRYYKAEYQNDVLVSTGNHAFDLGDSLYVKTYLASVAKYVEQTFQGAEKNYFNLDNGETIVDYKLSPFISNAISIQTTVTVTDTIPKGMIYNNDSVYGGTYTKGLTDASHGTVTDGVSITPAITQNADGSETLVWTMKNVDLSQTIPAIHYSCTIDREAAKNNQEFLNAASVKTTEDQRNPSTSAGNTATKAVKIIKLSGFSLTKLPDKEQYEVPDDIGWTMTWNNQSKNKESDVLMMDMMPYNGDGFGSDYHGSYTVKALKLKLDDPSKYTFVYTLDPAYRGKTTRDISTADALSSWTKGTIAADGTVTDLNGKTPVAWGIVGTLNGNTSLQGNIVIQTSGARADDDYYNGSTMMKAVVSGHSAYVSHNISGYAFLDANKNSRKDDGETMLPGTTVTLYPAGSRSNPVKTIDGANCVTSTDSSGFYEFKNVARGDYDAVFSGGDLPVLRMTSAGADNTGWTSKAAKEENSGKSEHAAIVEHAIDKAVEAAQKDVLSKITYRVDYTHINAGFYLSDFPKSKAVYNDAGKDINQRYVKDAQTLTYKITFRNLINAEQVFRITDAVPANSKFVSADNGGTLTDGTVSWGSIKVPAHGTGTVSFKVKAVGNQDQYMSIDNIANVWMLDGSGKPIEYIDPKTNTTHNQVRPDIALHKQVQDISGKDMDKLYVQKDDVLVYVLTVKNGDIPFKGTLSDRIPAGMSFLSADNAGANSDGTVTWMVDLKAGETKRYSFHVHVDENNGDFENTGILTDGVAPDLKSNTVYNQAGVIRISKKILNYLEAFGEPSFLYEIKGSDGTVSYRMIEISDPKAGASGSTIFSIPTGTAEGTSYDVAEIKDGRYAFVSANSSSPIVRKISDNLLRVTPIKKTRTAELSYENQINDWNKISHTDSVTNHIGG